jgi:hypothetical protein
MLRTLSALACILAAAAVTAVADAGPVAAKQRVVIQHKGAPFVLTPLTSGSIQQDTGTLTACCWSERHVMRDGQAIDINDPELTFTGKRGTLVARNVIGFVDVPGGWAVFTGTWRVIRGTGQYAGLAGGGRVAGIAAPSGYTRAQFEGFLVTK